MDVSPMLSFLVKGDRVKFTYRHVPAPLHRYGATASCGTHSDFDDVLEVDDIFISHGHTLLALRNPRIPISEHFYDKYVSISGDVYYYLDLQHDGIAVDTVEVVESAGFPVSRTDTYSNYYPNDVDEEVECYGPVSRTDTYSNYYPNDVDEEVECYGPVRRS